jgi:hypothetical protein
LSGSAGQSEHHDEPDEEKAPDRRRPRAKLRGSEPAQVGN